MNLVAPASLLVLLASDVAAQQMACMSRAQMVQKLAECGEVPVASGLSGNGSLIEILVSPAGTWSVIVGRPGGPVCLVISGGEWQAGIPAAAGRDS